MTIKDLKMTMTASISEVLETMFFMALEFEEHGDINTGGILDSPGLRVCRLSFSGTISGYFIVIIPESLLVVMAEDFMGEERDNITREHSDGIIKEVINMVAGNMFAAYDDQVEFKLGIPEMVEGEGVLETIKGNTPEGLVLAESIEGYLAFIVYADQ